MCLGLLAGCGRGKPADACRWPPALETRGWQAVNAGAFAFRAPSGMTERTLAGAPDRIGLRAAEERALAYHYGPGARDPRGRRTGGEESWGCETRIGGAAAVVRVGTREVEARPGLRQRQAVAEAWWPRAGPDSLPLLIVGWGPEADSARVAREALTAARSVRFGP